MGFVSKIVIPVFVSLIIHGVIFWALAYGWQAESKPKRIMPPRYIEAKLVQLESKSKKKAAAKKKPKKIDLTAKRKEQARLKREVERKKQVKIQKEKKEAEIKAKKVAAEKKRREEAQRKRDADEKKKQERQRMQQEFEQALLEEQGLLQEEEYATEAQSYKSKFAQRVEQNWNRPPSARTGMRCTLSIQLVPTGRIVSVDIAESSGNAAFDRSAVQAVNKVEIFPEVKEMSLQTFERYYRKFSFVFDPQDLRL